MIAVLAVGIFALPSTVSLFTGQHNWYSIGGEGEYLPCIKCHADVYEEYLMTDAHETLGNSTAPDAACYACHRAGRDITYATGNSSASVGIEAHAASTVACMDCHDFVGFKGAGGYPFAGGFSNMSNVTNSPYDYDDNNDTTNDGANAAHNEFIVGAINSTEMTDANEACIACHTHIPVTINWKHAYSLEFNASYDTGVTFPSTHFNTSNYSINGTAANIVSYGNYSGGANVSKWPTGNVTYWYSYYNDTTNQTEQIRSDT